MTQGSGGSQDHTRNQLYNRAYKNADQLVIAWIAETGVHPSKAILRTSRNGTYVTKMTSNERAISNIDEIVGLVALARRHLKQGDHKEAGKCLKLITDLITK